MYRFNDCILMVEKLKVIQIVELPGYQFEIVKNYIERPRNNLENEGEIISELVLKSK